MSTSGDEKVVFYFCSDEFQDIEQMNLFIRLLRVDVEKILSFNHCR